MKGFGITDRGVVRTENQDCFRIEIMEDTGNAAVVLCDGMGGAQAGSVASRIAAEAFMSHALSCFRRPDGVRDLSRTIRECSDYANIKVYDRSFSDFGCMGMGTTLVGVLRFEGETLVVNVGDSRAYLINTEFSERITRDHSLVEDLVRNGTITPEAAKLHPRRNVITRALGVEQQVKCDVFRPTLRDGDVLLLCSDGLSNLVEETEFIRILADSSDPEAYCRALLALAMERGAPDNVTVVALYL
ncbi:MAG: Stp1/IreP family PP2C-type Ser/Thr phosphatase [Eubacteriales bacterium]|nr:Stp1/IreP family PP2C-type Ser/Thr phosphatase [Eubacteriales bacterium]